jgi:hypothetical protein
MRKLWTINEMSDIKTETDSFHLVKYDSSIALQMFKESWAKILFFEKY